MSSVKFLLLSILAAVCLSEATATAQSTDQYSEQAIESMLPKRMGELRLREAQQEQNSTTIAIYDASSGQTKFMHASIQPVAGFYADNDEAVDAALKTVRAVIGIADANFIEETVTTPDRQRLECVTTDDNRNNRVSSQCAVVKRGLLLDLTFHASLNEGMEIDPVRSQNIRLISEFVDSYGSK